MEEKELVKRMMELHKFLEDREIYYPESLHLIECYISWVNLIVKQKELENKQNDRNRK